MKGCVFQIMVFIMRSGYKLSETLHGQGLSPVEIMLWKYIYMENHNNSQNKTFMWTVSWAMIVKQNSNHQSVLRTVWRALSDPLSFTNISEDPLSFPNISQDLSRIQYSLHSFYQCQVMMVNDETNLIAITVASSVTKDRHYQSYIAMATWLSSSLRVQDINIVLSRIYTLVIQLLSEALCVTCYLSFSLKLYVMLWHLLISVFRNSFWILLVLLHVFYLKPMNKTDTTSYVHWSLLTLSSSISCPSTSNIYMELEPTLASVYMVHLAQSRDVVLNLRPLFFQPS